MAARSIASFVLTFGLVAIPVKLYTAASAKTVSFNMLHKCGSRLKQDLRCPVDNVVVERSDTVRGYEYAKDQYVKFTEEEMKALETERDDSLELVEFVAASAIDHLQIEKSQYLGPDKGGDRAYRLLSLALLDTGRVGVGRWRTRSKDTLVIVRPYGDGGLVLHQIFYSTEIRDFSEVERANVVLHTSELNLARELVTRLTKPTFDVAKYYDTWAVKILAAVETKVDGGQIVAPPAVPAAERFDLLEALQRSVQAMKAAEPKGPRKAAPRGKAPRARRAV